MNSFAALRECLGIAASGSVLADSELLTLRQHFPTEGLLGPRRAFGAFSPSSNVVLWTAQWVWLRHVSALLLIAVLLANGSRGLVVPVLLMYGVATLILQFRGGLGNNGSDQMLFIIMVSSLMALYINYPPAALIFITAQASLSYATSGSVKIVSADWRNGRAVSSLMKTRTFGNPLFSRVLGHLPFSYSLGALIIGLELALAFATVLPPQICKVLLGFGFLLHLMIAVSMRLNTFIFAFAATYPAIWWCSQTLYSRHILK